MSLDNLLEILPHGVQLYKRRDFYTARMCNNVTNYVLYTNKAPTALETLTGLYNKLRKGGII